MTNPYPRYIQDETCPGVEVENPLYVAWDNGYETARQEAEKDRRSWENEVKKDKKIGFWQDWSGATHRVEILAETTDGRYMVEDVYGIRQWLVKKGDITRAEENEI